MFQKTQIIDMYRRSLHFTIFGAIEMFVKCKIVKIKDDFYTKTANWAKKKFRSPHFEQFFEFLFKIIYFIQFYLTQQFYVSKQDRVCGLAPSVGPFASSLSASLVRGHGGKRVHLDYLSEGVFLGVPQP